MQLRAVAPDVFGDVKRPWLEGVKNPCYRDGEGAVRCLPFLSIVGVSKCGTTDLYKKLMRLKCAALPGPHAAHVLRALDLSWPD